MMKKKVLKYILWIALIAACFLLQANFKKIFPVTIVPNFMLIVTFSVGFLKGRGAGMYTGLISGLLMDAFGGEVLGFYILIFMYSGYITGLMSDIFSHDTILVPIMLSAINELFYSIYIYIFGFLLFGRTNILDFISEIFIPELIITVIASILLYGVIMTISKRIDESIRKEENKFA